MADYLKYPVLFVHGMGFRDRKLFCYWGRTPKAFEARGCQVFLPDRTAVTPWRQTQPWWPAGSMRSLP